MDKKFQRYWKILYWKFKLSQFTAILLQSAAVTLAIIGVLSFFSMSWSTEFAIAFFILVAALVSVWSPIWLFSKSTLKEKMHKLFPPLEYSLDLFFKDYESAVTDLQKQKIVQRLPAWQKVPVDEKWGRLLLVLVLSVGIYFIGINNFKANINAVSLPNTMEETDTPVKADSKSFQKGNLDIIVNPPPYTRLQKYQWQKDEKVPEGSKVTFEVKGGNTVPFLIQQGKDTLSFSKDKRTWEKHLWLNYATAFQIYFQQDDSIVNDKLVVVEIQRDQKPVVTTNLDQNRVEIPWEQLKNIFELSLSLSDDYGLSQANVVATLSKGDGESVKFRELKWPISQFEPGYKSQNMEYGLRIDTLGLDPGDELYFYFEVWDNKYPDPQSSKSEVYFIEVNDTVQQESVAFEGLALSTEPEFFKSQRQIIIDTEKLIQDQSRLSVNAFDDKSDEIGADQKILRLRYGIFLGEEYEVKGGLGETAGDEEDHSGHDHEGEDHDHAAHEENGAQPNERSFSDELYNSPELAAYVHSHDNSEVATFFDAEVKQKLKAALANMWEAELYLRTYRPKMALPYEYRALELIKEVQRASRIYVERMGFEPPPLEPDKKRLTGNLKAIQPNTGVYTADSEQFIDELQAITSKMKQYAYADVPQMKRKLLVDLSDLLINEMIENPVRYAQILASVNQFKQSGSQEIFRQIILMAEQILPVPERELTGAKTNQLQIQSIFHQQLQPK